MFLGWLSARIFDRVWEALRKLRSCRLPVLISRKRHEDLLQSERTLKVVVKATGEMREKLDQDSEAHRDSA